MKTKIADVIVPAIFAPYALERTTELSELVKAGIIGLDEGFNAYASGAGKTVDLPFWKDLSGDSEVLNDSADLTVDKITSGQDTAAIHNRGKAWGSNILARLLSGSDPQGQIADLVADYWQRDLQTMVLKVLEGLFDPTAGVLRTTHRLNIYSDSVAGSITDAMRARNRKAGLPVGESRKSGARCGVRAYSLEHT